MKRLLSTMLFSIIVPSAISSETIEFRSDSEILVVRGFETSLGWVQFDILGSKDGTVLCVALDKAGNPIATTTGFSNVGYVAFVEIELEAIASVRCRYN